MQRGMQKMPVESSLDGTRPWRCVCAAAGAVELAAPACRGRLATSTAGLLLVVLAGLALAGRIGTHGKGTMAPAPPGLAKKPASHLPPHLPFGVVAAPCNHSIVPVQHFTTDLHTNPHTEQIFVGGLPCLADHCHTHDPSEGLGVCVARGKPGCCLSRGEWSDRWRANLVAIVACSNRDPGQLWSKSGGSVTSSDGPQLCLDGPNICLTHRSGEPLLVGPRSSPYQPGQDWSMTGGHSIFYPGKVLSTVHVASHQDCLTQCSTDPTHECRKVHYDEASSTCELHATDMCLTAVPP